MNHEHLNALRIVVSINDLIRALRNIARYKCHIGKKCFEQGVNQSIYFHVVLIIYWTAFTLFALTALDPGCNPDRSATCTLSIVLRKLVQLGQGQAFLSQYLGSDPER
jgi:hypothetical protein